MQDCVGAHGGWGNQMRPLRKDGLAALEEHEQVGRPVEVDVYDGPCMFARGGVEFLDEIDTVVEVAIGLAAYERTMFVVLLNIRSAIEVGIDGHLRELALTIVHAPDVGPSVVVLIFGADVTAGWPQRHGRGRRARQGAQADHQ
jgi:hypothetical protein